MKAKEYIILRSDIICDQKSMMKLKVIEFCDANKAIDMAVNEVRKEYEDIYKHIEETLEAIVNDCSRLTPGNVSHNAAGIQGAAQRRLDYIRKHKDGNT